MTEQVKPTEGAPVEKLPVEAKTIQQIAEEVAPTGDKKPEGEDKVPLATFLDVKKDAKRLEKQVAELQAQISSGDFSKKEVSASIEAMAEKFDVDPAFMSEFRQTILAEVTAEAEKKAGEILKPILERDADLTKKEREAQIEKAFRKHYGEALERMPEFNEIADADTIKALSLLPQNANKTFAQLIEDTYGKAIVGKRTIEPTKPNGGKEPTSLDFEKARADTEYFKQVMANPQLKAEYNKKMLEPKGRRS